MDFDREMELENAGIDAFEFSLTRMIMTLSNMVPASTPGAIFKMQDLCAIALHGAMIHLGV